MPPPKSDPTYKQDKVDLPILSTLKYWQFHLLNTVSISQL